MKKKSLLQRKWVWVVIIIIIGIGYFEISTTIKQNSRAAETEELTKNADKILKDKVELPDTYFKSKEEVEALYEEVGLKVKFVVSNFDEKADLNEELVKKGDCDQIDYEQKNVTYFSSSEVGDKSGPYADKGATIIVGYSDHDYDGRKSEESSAKEENSTISSEKQKQKDKKAKADEQAKKEKDAEKAKAEEEADKQKGSDITQLSQDPTSDQEELLTELAVNEFDNVYPYKGSKLHLILGRIQGWTQKDDVWYSKYEATIANAFGAKREANVEITISPVSPSSGYVSFIDY
ncbi:hypothetical protein MZV44_002939 [Listeria monocytogenes]|nr:hypothetical protein [Listeria monocytogenes]EJC6460009.1 hypothetical protein [Listeria monocytogenes]MCM64423.1 hypothetical protein [Listeria monocytogenes]